MNLVDALSVPLKLMGEHVTQEQADARWAVCRGCDHVKYSRVPVVGVLARCGKCDCILGAGDTKETVCPRMKTLLRAEVCPAGKW